MRDVKKGQVYGVKNRNEHINTYLFMVLDVLDNGVVTVVPVFLWTELMGPDDIMLPKVFLGAFMALSFELEATISEKELDTYVSSLKEEEVSYVMEAYMSFNRGEKDRSYTWGHEYLDSYDLRMKYHVSILEEIEAMQSKSIGELFNE